MTIIVRFEHLAKELTPTKEFTKQGHVLADKVFKVLMMGAAGGGGVNDCNISKCVIAGNPGSGTGSEVNEDFNLVVMLNEAIPKKHGEVMAKFVAGFKTAVDAKILPDVKIIKNTKYSLQFETSLVVDQKQKVVVVDLFPSINFTRNLAMRDENEINRFGGANGRAGDLVYSLSPTLVEEMFKFIKEIGEPSIRGVILVAKFWDRIVKEKTKNTVNGCEEISGRSYIIELIALHANTNLLGLQPKEKNLVYYGFIRFLKAMAYLDMLSVTFFEKYEESDVPLSVMRERKKLPFILDPVNRWNNWGKELHGKKGLVEAYKKFAAGTLQALEELEGEEGSPSNSKTIGANTLNVNNFHEFIVSA